MSLCVKFLIEDVRCCRSGFYYPKNRLVEYSWNMMAHGDAREGKWRGDWRMEWVASTLHTTSEHGVSSITTADAHTSAASSRLNWRPRRFKWNSPFRRKTKSGFCACAITFQTQSTVRISSRGSCCVSDQTSLFRCPAVFMYRVTYSVRHVSTLNFALSLVITCVWWDTDIAVRLFC